VAFCGSSTTAATGIGGRKGCSTGGGGGWVTPFKGGTRRWQRAAETVGGTVGASRRE
jgi:hypothetical protein